VVVSGRYNGNTVDLNRNFDCDWQASGVWQSTQVSGGSKAFSEPEPSLAIKTYVEKISQRLLLRTTAPLGECLLQIVTTVFFQKPSLD
jgi:hypothetical protein